MNNRGFILVASYMVVAVLIILATTFSARSIGEKRVADKERDTVQALWLAEAGVDRAIIELPNTPLSGTLGIGAYSTQTTALGSGKYLINSTGGVPLATISPNNAIRKVSAVVQQPLNPANPGDVTSAITANGDVTVKGSAQVNGTIDEENEVFNFEDVFGISKDAMKSGAVHHYTDPANNITPVDHSTWVDIDTATEMKISDSGWSGSGILVVNGNLTITGGHFSGIIWVIGTLRISGNPILDGAFFVESGAEVDTTLTGNPIVSFNGNAVSSAFGFIPSMSAPQIIGWKED
ncbi:MAG: type II secretion system protein [Candidatus Omnitrophota bacterium]|nr:type II secretion system protein [Candidatus Omnitrophota bacterium]